MRAPLVDRHIFRHVYQLEEAIERRDETNRISAGRYIDRLERRGGQWKIASRATLLECAGVIPPKTTPAIEKLFAEPGTPGASSWDRNDPSYRR